MILRGTTAPYPTEFAESVPKIGSKSSNIRCGLNSFCMSNSAPCYFLGKLKGKEPNIEEHLLPDPRPVYVITIFENFSRMVLSSKISATQNQWDYLAVLADALRHYGAPEAIVTDGGGIFSSSPALRHAWYPQRAH